MLIAFERHGSPERAGWIALFHSAIEEKKKQFSPAIQAQLTPERFRIRFFRTVNGVPAEMRAEIKIILPGQDFGILRFTVRVAHES